MLYDLNGNLPNWASAAIGVAVIGGLAVATALTGGVVGVVCGAALVGSIVGGGIGTAVGFAVGGVDGAFTGFAAGALLGGAVGAITSSVNIALGSVKILGSAQKTGTILHQMASNVEAGKMTLQIGKYSTVALDTSLKKAGLTGARRPDVTGIARHGKNKLIEVVSKSQTV